MGWGKDSKKAKVIHTNKAKQEIKSCFPHAVRCSTLSRRAGPHHSNRDLGRNSPLFQMSLIPTSSPHLTYWAWCQMVWTIPLVSWGHLTQLCLLPPSHAPQISSAVWPYTGQKRPWLWVNPAHQQQKHPHIINPMFSTNPKHSPILANGKKINYPSWNQHRPLCITIRVKTLYSLYWVLSMDIVEFCLSNLLQTVRNAYIRGNYRNIHCLLSFHDA